MGDITSKQRIILPGDPTLAMHAATKQYVDAGVSAYACKVYNDSNSGTLNNVTADLIYWASEAYDTANMHSTSSNTSRVYMPVAGIYSICAFYSFPANGSGQRVLLTRKNGSIQQMYANTNTYGSLDRTRMSIVYEEQFAANDYIELIAYQNSGSNLSPKYSTSGWDSHMTVRLVQQV